MQLHSNTLETTRNTMATTQNAWQMLFKFLNFNWGSKQQIQIYI